MKSIKEVSTVGVVNKLSRVDGWVGGSSGTKANSVSNWSWGWSWDWASQYKNFTESPVYIMANKSSPCSCQVYPVLLHTCAVIFPVSWSCYYCSNIILVYQRKKKIPTLQEIKPKKFYQLYISDDFSIHHQTVILFPVSTTSWYCCSNIICC